MLIKNEFEVAEPVEKVWRFFDDIPQVASCLPGAELTENLGDDRYKGRVAVRMGRCLDLPARHAQHRLRSSPARSPPDLADPLRQRTRPAPLTLAPARLAPRYLFHVPASSRCRHLINDPTCKNSVRL